MDTHVEDTKMLIQGHISLSSGESSQTTFGQWSRIDLFDTEFPREKCFPEADNFMKWTTKSKLKEQKVCCLNGP